MDCPAIPLILSVEENHVNWFKTLRKNRVSPDSQLPVTHFHHPQVELESQPSDSCRSGTPWIGKPCDWPCGLGLGVEFLSKGAPGWSKDFLTWNHCSKKTWNLTWHNDTSSNHVCKVSCKPRFVSPGAICGNLKCTSQNMCDETMKILQRHGQTFIAATLTEEKTEISTSPLCDSFIPGLHTIWLGFHLLTKARWRKARF